MHVIYDDDHLYVKFFKIGECFSSPFSDHIYVFIVKKRFIGHVSIFLTFLWALFTWWVDEFESKLREIINLDG